MTRLRYVLAQKGLTGKQFAQICGVSCSTIYKYMSNCRTLSKKVAARLAQYLDVDPEDLLGYVDV